MDTGNSIDFGRVIYVEPNNNIYGTGKGTNFTFEPEDYSILVDLQVDVVDRFSSVGNGNNIIEYTLEWDAKGTRTTMFKGTNGFLSTNALDTTFFDVSTNANQEAIGINSIDIRYNSWNYPEISIQFTDIRGAALLSASDYANSVADVDGKKDKMVESFANTFFTTFFRFPYPRYTLIVKGFYGRPVSYSLCVSDFKTKFNSNTGNFDVTVSFIGYMYGLFTDIPMRILYAAPLIEPFGREYWDNNVKSGKFMFRDRSEHREVPMIRLNELYDKVKCFNVNVSADTRMQEIAKEADEAQKNLDSINDGIYPKYLDFCSSGSRSKLEIRTMDSDGKVSEGSRYLFVFKKVEGTEINGVFPVETSDDVKSKENFASNIKSYNESVSNEGYSLPEINGLDTRNYEDSDKPLKGIVIYQLEAGGKCNVIETNVKEFLNSKIIKEDYDEVQKYLSGETCMNIATELLKENGGIVAVGAYNITNFDKAILTRKQELENILQAKQKQYKEQGTELLNDALGFRITLRTMIDLCLAHLDTFMAAVYYCMDKVKTMNRKFNMVNLNVSETDVRSSATDGDVFLPPFFSFKRKGKDDSFEDAWIGDDNRFSNREMFPEIELVDALFNGMLEAMKESELTAEGLKLDLPASVKNSTFAGGKIGNEFWSLFVKDYINDVNPYEKNVGPNEELESLIGLFAFRLLEATIYTSDKEAFNSDKRTKYFEKFGEFDAKNFMKTQRFQDFKNGNLRDRFNNINTENFICYITKPANCEGNSLMNNYSSSNMDSPMFTASSDSDGVKTYYPSYGNKNGKYVVPVFYKDVTDAVSIGDAIYGATTPNESGFGISRSNGMPKIRVVPSDLVFENDGGEIKKCTAEIGTKLVGFGFEDEWVNYFEIPDRKGGRDRKVAWFPPLTLKNCVVSSDKDTEGNLYLEKENEKKQVPYSPGEDNSDLADFFVESWGYHIKDVGNEKVETDIIRNIKTNESTLVGLVCGEGTLFQHEFYLIQTDLYAKAFLFLHSLPTSEPVSFMNAVKTFINDSYSPFMSNIPYSTALFLGAIFWREREEREERENNKIAFGNVYKVADYKHFITYEQNKNRCRPLAPIPLNTKEKKNKEYVEIDNTIFSVDEYLKGLFIQLFDEWVKNSFDEIDGCLVLKTSGGARYTQDMLNNVWTKMRGFNKSNIKGYNNFLKENFDSSTWEYYCKLGANRNETSLMAMFRMDTKPLTDINNILKRGCVITVPFPRALLLKDILTSTDEVKGLTVSKTDIEKAWNSFYNTLQSGITKAIEEEENANRDAFHSLPANVTSEQKLSLYETIKNLHDKWLIATAKEKYEFSNITGETGNGRRSISKNFYFINSFYEDIGDEIVLNGEELPKQIESMLNSNDNANSIYSFMYDIANQVRVQLLALPIFNDMSDASYVRSMFTPMPFDKIDFTCGDTESQYVFYYPEEASKQLDIEAYPNDAEERYKFVDDSFTFVTENLMEHPETLPKTFMDESENSRKVPVFGVTFAKQNQGFFKNINVSMDSPKTTEVAIQNTVLMAGKAKGGNSQVTALGQDLFPIYSNYSYECSVEMMGCACIMPLMYFQLNNIPMFKGSYIIYNVSHSITPGNMTTTFVGQRLSRYRKKRNENAYTSKPNADASGSYYGPGGVYGEECCTETGNQLKHDSEYSTLSKNTGIEDKAILRAIEYAETHNTGGFYSDGKLRVVYDPWIAKNRHPEASSDLTVSNQFDTNFTVPSTYDGNMSMIERLGFGGKECAEIGAFGIPGEAFARCGVFSVDSLYSEASKGFEKQCILFGNLLKCEPKMIESLKAHNWLEFAKIYKGEHGTTLKGVYMPGDNDAFENYAKDLETGYQDASSTKTSGCGAGAPPRVGTPITNGRWIYENPVHYKNDSGHGLMRYPVGGPLQPSNPSASAAYALEHPLHCLKARDWLTGSNTGVNKVYSLGFPARIQTTPETFKSRSKGNWYYDGNVNTKKDPTRPIKRCATYVKLAIAKGKTDKKDDYYIGGDSCDGGWCGPKMVEYGWDEIYRSAPGDDPRSSEFNAHWEIGDVMTIDYLRGEEPKDGGLGHIMMWTGDRWVSDFSQNSCQTYGTWEYGWNRGWYHVFRYKNVIND